MVQQYLRLKSLKFIIIIEMGLHYSPNTNDATERTNVNGLAEHFQRRSVWSKR